MPAVCFGLTLFAAFKIEAEISISSSLKLSFDIMEVVDMMVNIILMLAGGVGFNGGFTQSACQRKHQNNWI